MKRALPFVIILLVLGVALGAAWYLKQNTTAPSTQPSKSAANESRDTRPAALTPEPGAEPAHTIGPAGAPVTLEEFGDFECPPCGLLHPILKQIEHEYGSRVRIVFREFPLVPTHEHALAAARAAEAAGIQGKFWEMHDLLYENQKAWHTTFDVRPIFESYATRIGLDVERFRRDLTSDIVERRIFLDGKRGRSLDVTGTPTVFLNGQELPYESLQPSKLRPLIDAELTRGSK
jgi:protein-disulfide isomerase